MSTRIKNSKPIVALSLIQAAIGDTNKHIISLVAKANKLSIRRMRQQMEKHNSIINRSVFAKELKIVGLQCFLLQELVQWILYTLVSEKNVKIFKIPSNRSLSILR